VSAIIDELEADHAVWESEAAVLQRVVGRGRAGQDVDWRSPASEAYLNALESWVRDGTGLLDAADGVLAALRAHLDALREVRDAVALAESTAGDALTSPLLPELLREGGLL